MRIPKWLPSGLKQWNQILNADFIVIFHYIDELKKLFTRVIQIKLVDKILYFDTVNNIFIDIQPTIPLFNGPIHSLADLSDCFECGIMKSRTNVYYIANILYYFLDLPIDIIRMICSNLYNYAIINLCDEGIAHSSYQEIKTTENFNIFEGEKNKIKLWEL